MTHDLDPGVIIIITSLVLKIENHFLSKSCSELTLNLKSKENSDMTHDPINQVFQVSQFFNTFLDRLRSKFLVMFLYCDCYMAKRSIPK